MSIRIPSIRSAMLSLALATAPHTATAGFFDQMIDPEDGQFDVSNYLASARGFLPVPIIITEPAIGYGLGAAVAYFHKPTELDPALHEVAAPPSITMGMGAATQNGTWMAGAAHRGIWKKDRIRYIGALFGVNLVADVYPSLDLPGGNSSNAPIEFNLESALIYQRLQFRLKDSKWWLGADYIFGDNTNTLTPGQDLPPGFPELKRDFKLASLGAFVEYDSRNTTFTPTQGISAKAKYSNSDDKWGSDFEYDLWEAYILHYTPIGDYSSLGLRLEGDGSSGELPFFAYPFVDLRGIPALRYQGSSVVTAEAEFLWGLTPRWTLVLFGGVGKTSAIGKYQSEGETVGAGGAGFRYRLARKMGLQAGIDIARGPEEWAFYITVGSAWGGK